MPSDSYTYRVFPTEIISNTFDFEVRWVVHNGKRMRGVFARRPVEPWECPLYLGSYPGYKKTRGEIVDKASRYIARHPTVKQVDVHQLGAYSLSLNQYDPDCVLDPTNEEGELLPEFTPCIVIYVNEPPPGRHQNAEFVYNRPRQRYEVWLMHAVEQYEEVFLYYGKRYRRDYPINDEAIDDQLAYFIPALSVLKPDPRGVPLALRMPD